MKKLIVLIVFVMLANSPMDEQSSKRSKEEKFALLKAKIKEVLNFAETTKEENEFVLMMHPSYKPIKLVCSNEVTLEMVKHYLYAHHRNEYMPLTIEKQIFYPISSSITHDITIQRPLHASDDQKNMVDIMDEQKTDAFVVFGPLRPLSINLNEKIAALANNKRDTRKN